VGQVEGYAEGSWAEKGMAFCQRAELKPGEQVPRPCAAACSRLQWRHQDTSCNLRSYASAYLSHSHCLSLTLCHCQCLPLSLSLSLCLLHLPCMCHVYACDKALRHAGCTAYLHLLLLFAMQSFPDLVLQTSVPVPVPGPGPVPGPEATPSAPQATFAPYLLCVGVRCATGEACLAPLTASQPPGQAGPYAQEPVWDPLPLSPLPRAATHTGVAARPATARRDGDGEVGGRGRAQEVGDMPGECSAERGVGRRQEASGCDGRSRSWLGRLHGRSGAPAAALADGWGTGGFGGRMGRAEVVWVSVCEWCSPRTRGLEAGEPGGGWACASRARDAGSGCKLCE